MERRTFIKYSMATGATLILPQNASALDWNDAKKYAEEAVSFIQDEGPKMVKAAIYCSKLNPARLIGGYIFDELKDVLVDPLIDKFYDYFLDDKKIPSKYLTYASTEDARKQVIENEQYKASIIVQDTDKTSFRRLKNDKIELELEQKYDAERFNLLRAYLEDEKAKVRLYDGNRPKLVGVGKDLTPNDLLNLEYISFRKHENKVHFQNLFEATNNSVFTNLVV